MIPSRKIVAESVRLDLENLSPELWAKALKFKSASMVGLAVFSPWLIQAATTYLSTKECQQCELRFDDGGHLLDAHCSCGGSKEEPCVHIAAAILSSSDIDERDFSAASKAKKLSISSLRSGIRNYASAFSGYRLIALTDLLVHGNEGLFDNPGLLPETYAYALKEGLAHARGETDEQGLYRGIVAVMEDRDLDDPEQKSWYRSILPVLNEDRRRLFALACLKSPSLRASMSCLFVDFYDRDGTDLMMESIFYPSLSWQELGELDPHQFARFLALYKGSDEEFSYLIRLYRDKLDDEDVAALLANPAFSRGLIPMLPISEDRRLALLEEAKIAKLSEMEPLTFLQEVSSYDRDELIRQSEFASLAKRKGCEDAFAFLLGQGEAKDIANLPVEELLAICAAIDVSDASYREALLNRLDKIPVARYKEFFACLPRGLKEFFLDHYQAVELSLGEKLSFARHFDALTELGYRRYDLCIS